MRKSHRCADFDPQKDRGKIVMATTNNRRNARSAAFAYAGKKAVLATMHSKEIAIAPALLAATGLVLVPTTGLDTDLLGTFAGEVARNGTMREVAVRKARLGMDLSGIALGVASEGSFGPHPVIPFLTAGIELMAFVDGERNTVIAESIVAEHTNFNHLVVSPDEDFETFLHLVGFPSHALIVRPNKNETSQGLCKGLVQRSDLDCAINRAASFSADRKVRLETDMRAHVNPTRMKSLEVLAERLGQRLATPCPECNAPGFGRTGVRKGLICEDCGAETEMFAAEILSCSMCELSKDQHRSDSLTRAPAANCPDCNP